MKMKNKVLLIFLISIFFSISLIADNIDDLIRSYIDGRKKYSVENEILKKILSKDENKIINATIPYLNDSLKIVRSSAMLIIYEVGWKSNDKQVRQKAVKILSERIDDKDAGLVKMAIDYLKNFYFEDFDNEVKYKIYLKVLENHSYYSDLVLLTGFLQINELIDLYQAKLKDDKYSSREKWYILLALGRMGDIKAINKIVKIIKKMPVNEDAVSELFPDLVYVRQKEVFDEMLDVIMNDEKNCLSSDPDNEVPIICAFKVIELVAKYIKDFPVKVDEYGEVIINNYNETLKKVREWIEQNGFNYELITNKF